MADSIWKLIYYIVYSLELFVVGEIVFHNRVKGWYRYIVAVILYLAIIIPLVLSNGKLPLWGNLLLDVSLYMFLFQGKLVSRLKHFWGIYIFTGMTEGIVSGIGTFILQCFFYGLDISIVSNGVRLVLAFIAAAITIAITAGKWTKKLVDSFRALKWFQYAVVIIAALGTGLLLAIGEVASTYMENKEIGMILHSAAFVTVVAVFFGAVWFMFSVYEKEYYLKQNWLKEEIINAQQKYYQRVYENDREMRKFRHDVYAQLGYLQQLLAEGKAEQARKHLDTIETHFSQITINKFYTGNEVLDVILYQTWIEANKKGIDIKVEGRLENSDAVDAYDLCMIFVNALHNGIEACEVLPDRERIIRVSVLEHGNTRFFQFVNPATEQMYEMARQNRTTKRDSRNHGFGIENMRTTVEKYGGELEYRYQNGMLILEICFGV